MVRIVVSTGAGISAAAGLSTYRGSEGLWTLNPRLEKLSTVNKVSENLDTLLAHWGPFRSTVLTCSPTAAHYAITEAQTRLDSQAGPGNSVRIITQNVDNLHQKSGSRNVIELHGNVLHSYCVQSRLGGKGCINKGSWYDPNPTFSSCEVCGGPTRPDIVLFGESLPKSAWQAAEDACLNATVFIAVGTSGIVFPAADLVSIAKKMGARTVLINKEIWDYPHPDFDEVLLGSADELLPPLLSSLS